MNVTHVHRQLIKELKATARPVGNSWSSERYTGSKHDFYNVTVPERRVMLKVVLKENKGASPEDWLLLVDALMAGKSHEEKTMGAMLLGYEREARKAAGFQRLDAWLSLLHGWAEVDSLCQNVFKADELLDNWKSWEKFLKKLRTDTNVNKRRASLVFLTGPTSQSADARLHTLAYENMDGLKHEKDILITKAISWLLRSMADSNKKEVALYLENNSETLPKIAIRETRTKLRTGKKNK